MMRKAESIFLICIDIQDLKDAQQALERQRTSAETVSRLAVLGELTSNIAHEIRNPLTAISLSSEILRKEMEKPNWSGVQCKDYAEKIFSIAQRINTIITSLINLAHSSESTPYSIERLDRMISDAVALVRLKFQASQIPLVVNPIPEDIWIRCRPVEITQVLLNLLNNAFDACKDQREKWVRVSARVVHEDVTIVVEDSGPGVAPALGERIFEPFFTTKPPGLGTGIGLSISRRIAKSHDGGVTLDPSAKHTTFLFHLPVAHISKAAAS